MDLTQALTIVASVIGAGTAIGTFLTSARSADMTVMQTIVKELRTSLEEEREENKELLKRIEKLEASNERLRKRVNELQGTDTGQHKAVTGGNK